ncbi:hypothetical protein [Desertivirga brevis]|nr:hypothetical protein [Pedobacter sp. SYSU D00873]
MATGLSTDNLVHHLINWFNSNAKTEILDRNKREAIVRLKFM